MKPENTFIQNVHRHLTGVYFEKTNNPFRGNMADVYYEGSGIIMWIEYKWIPTPWKTDLSCEQICRTKSWVGQRRWLTRAYHNGIKAFVVIGVGSGRFASAYILPWPYHFTVDKNQLITVQQLRTWILEQVT